MLGSEGTLGVITEVSCRVRPAPEMRRYEGWMAEDFEAGREIVRDLAQSHEAPDVLRLSDEEETRVSLDLAGTEGLQKRALDAYLSLRRRRGGCLMICGWEGERESVAPPPLARARRGCGSAARCRSGAAAGRSWERNRYDGPYLRDELMDLGVLVETLETAHTWSRLDELYRGRRRRAARGALGERSIVMCHVSHAYADGASLYFTFLARARPRRGARAVARGQDGGLRGDRRRRGDDHPPPRRRARPRALHARRGGRARHRRAAGRQGAARSGRDHEPRQAAASMNGLLLG